MVGLPILSRELDVADFADELDDTRVIERVLVGVVDLVGLGSPCPIGGELAAPDVDFNCVKFVDIKAEKLVAFVAVVVLVESGCEADFNEGLLEAFSLGHVWLALWWGCHPFYHEPSSSSSSPTSLRLAACTCRTSWTRWFPWLDGGGGDSIGFAVDFAQDYGDEVLLAFGWLEVFLGQLDGCGFIIGPSFGLPAVVEGDVAAAACRFVVDLVAVLGAVHVCSCSWWEFCSVSYHQL